MFVPSPYRPPRKGARYSYGEESWKDLLLWWLLPSLVVTAIAIGCLALTGAFGPTNGPTTPKTPSGESERGR